MHNRAKQEGKSDEEAINIRRKTIEEFQKDSIKLDEIYYTFNSLAIWIQFLLEYFFIKFNNLFRSVSVQIFLFKLGLILLSQYDWHSIGKRPSTF